MPVKKLSRLFITVSALLTLLTSCSDPAPAKQQILAQLEIGRAGVESFKPKQVNSILAPGFLAENQDSSTQHRTQGEQLDREKLRNLIRMQAFQKQKLNITLGPVNITMDEHNTTLANMETTAVVTGGRGLIPNDGRIYKVTGQWRLIEGDWLLNKIHWE